MARRKAKKGELTPAELLKFGILPPEPEKSERVKGSAPETPEEAFRLQKLPPRKVFTLIEKKTETEKNDDHK